MEQWLLWQPESFVNGQPYQKVSLVPRAMMSFSCRTQLPVMTLIPTYTFAGNLFHAFVMYATVGLRGSRRFGLVLAGTWLCPETDRAVAQLS